MWKFIIMLQVMVIMHGTTFIYVPSTTLFTLQKQKLIPNRLYFQNILYLIIEVKKKGLTFIP